MKTVVQTTSDYGMFGKFSGNRPTNESHIRKIAASMSAFGWIEAYPMHVVNLGGKLSIVDGQHRFEAAQRLGIPVRFVVTECHNVDVAKINGTQFKWSPDDYVRKFVSEGNKHYVALAEFMAQTGFPLSTAAGLLGAQTYGGGGCAGGNAMPHLKDGTFVVKTLQVAQIVAGICAEVGAVYPHATDGRLAMSLARCCYIERFEPLRMRKRMVAHHSLLRKCATQEEQIALLEEVYNFKATARDRLPLAFLAKQVAVQRNAVRKSA